jgi:hypothetical protein
MNKAAAIAILAVMIAGCAGREEVSRTGHDEPLRGDGYHRPAEPNFPTGVPGTGVPGSAPGGIR